MNHLLTAKTIRGRVSWLDVARGDALDQLQQDYARIKAYETLRSIQVLCIKVASNTIIDWVRYIYQVELMSQEHAALRLYLMMSNVRSVRELIQDLLDRVGLRGLY